MKIAVACSAALAIAVSTAATALALGASATPASALALAEDPPLRGAVSPIEGVLFGGQPSEEELAALADAGYTVIDLRPPEEDRGYDERALAERLGLAYHNVPVDRDALSEPATYESFFELFEDADKPLVVHCASGNRVGGLYYAYLVVRRGVPREEALEQARAHGLRSDSLREAIDRYLDSRPPADRPDEPRPD